jgi:hypothetical protein
MPVLATDRLVRLALASLLACATAACGAGDTTVQITNDDRDNDNDGAGGRPATDASGRPSGNQDATDNGGGTDGTADSGVDDDTAGDPDDATPNPDALPVPDVGPPLDAGPVPYGGPPEIVTVFPQVAVPEGIVYIDGRQLARSDGDYADTVVRVEAADGSIIPLTILAGSPVRLVVITPPDYATRLGDAGRIAVQTPEGTDDFYPVFATTDFTFTGKTNPGEGTLGNVYRLVAETRLLPNLDAPCGGADPTVVDDATTPCPYTSIVAPQIDIPDREFDIGFPGLGTDLVEWFAIRFTGYLDLDTVGDYAFQVCSDDGSILRINNDAGLQTVVSNDGAHSFQCAEGTVSIASSPTLFILDYFQGPRNRIGLQWNWRPPGATEWTIVPADVIRVFPD